jgi:hypothetical protein
MFERCGNVTISIDDTKIELTPSGRDGVMDEDRWTAFEDGVRRLGWIKKIDPGFSAERYPCYVPETRTFPKLLEAVRWLFENPRKVTW